MTDHAYHPLLRINATELQLPAIDYGVHLCLDLRELPQGNPLAAHRADFCIEINGQKRELSWEALFKLLGMEQ